ncbi:MAG: hypothetical protein DMF68_18500 [Acidobacteria bacterium]|nr:MAG: hypothetical protein DMF68_18500 [Acidobacteriota bacterium]
MKRCPACQRTYEDDSLAFCLEDGSTLVSEGSAASDLPATLIIADPRLTNPVRPETAPVAPVQPRPPQPYTQPQPAWSPMQQPQMYPMISPRQGRGLAITSLICAIAGFLLLVICIALGSAGANPNLLGGIFLLSALIGLVGAVLGIVAVVKAGRDTSPQNSKAMAVVSLVLNCVYLLIVVIILTLGVIANSR